MRCTLFTPAFLAISPTVNIKFDTFCSIARLSHSVATIGRPNRFFFPQYSGSFNKLYTTTFRLLENNLAISYRR